MPFQEDIEVQRELLAAHRRTLSIYLRQLASSGFVHAPPTVLNGIQEARGNIARIKTVLRDWGVEVEDLPDDRESFSEQAKIIDQTGKASLDGSDRVVAELDSRAGEVASTSPSNFLITLYKELAQEVNIHLGEFISEAKQELSVPLHSRFESLSFIDWVFWFFVCSLGLATPFVHKSRYLKWILFAGSAIYLALILTFQSVNSLKPYTLDPHLTINTPLINIPISLFDIVLFPLGAIYLASLYLGGTESYTLWKQYYRKESVLDKSED